MRPLPRDGRVQEVQCRIGVGGGCPFKARTLRTPPSDTPVQNQACIPRVWMAVRYPGSPLPRPLGESVRRGDESPLWMGPDVYAGTLPASPLHPHQRGRHPPFSVAGWGLPSPAGPFVSGKVVSQRCTTPRELIQPHAIPSPLSAVPPRAD